MINKRCYRQSSLILFLGLSTPMGVTLAANPTNLKSPEIEIQRAIEAMDVILKRSEASNMIANFESIGPVMFSVERAFQLGEQAFNANEPLLASRYLEYYVQGAQVPEAEKLKVAYFRLGRSLEMANLPGKAIKSYISYLAIQVTSPKTDRDQLLEVMRRLLSLNVSQTMAEKKRIAELLATITTLDLTQDVQSELFFYTGYFSSVVGLKKQAIDFYEQSLKRSKDQWVQAQTHYYYGHLLGSSGAIDQAIEQFKAVIGLPDQAAKDMKDLAALAMGRLMVLKKKPETSLDFYHQVRPTSVRYREAQFECIYVLIDLGRYDEASKEAEKYLKSYPDHEESYKIKTLIGYLNLRSGKFKEALTAIESADNSLVGTLGWLRANFRNGAVVKRGDVEKIFKVTNQQVIQPPIITKSRAIFDRLARDMQNSDDTRNTVQQSIYVMGRANIALLHPYGVQSLKQIEKEVENVLLIGQKIIESEKYLYSEAFTPAEKKELEAGEQRRLKAFGIIKSPLYYRGDSTALNQQTLMTRRLAEMVDKLRKLKAQTAAAKLIASVSTNKKDSLRLKSFDLLQDRLSAQEKSQNRAVEILRARATNELIQHSPFQKIKLMIRQYASALHEESAILYPYRDSYQTISERHLKDDINLAWDRWENVLKSLYQDLNQQESRIRADIKSEVAGFEQHVARIELIKMKNDSLIAQIEDSLSEQLPDIMTHYVQHIEQRRAQHQKWMADIDWLIANKISDDRNVMNRKFELSKVMLEENLKDLEQTRSWQWGQP